MDDLLKNIGEIYRLPQLENRSSPVITSNPPKVSICLMVLSADPNYRSSTCRRFPGEVIRLSILIKSLEIG